MRPRRILIIINSLGLGGTEKQLVQLLPKFDKTAWRIAVLCLSSPNPLAESLQAEGIMISTPDPNRTTYHNSIARVHHTIKRQQPDIIHCFLPKAYLIAGMVSLFSGHRIRIMSRRSRNHYQRKYPFSRQLEMWLHRHMDAIIGNSQAVIRDLDDEGVPKHKRHLIYNGVAPTVPLDKSAARQQTNLPQDALVFIMVANLIPYKGHQDLLQALAQTNIDRPWQLVYVGRDDGIGASLQTLATKLGIADDIVWTGALTDLVPWLSSADVGVLSSHQEGFSNAILEYLAYGLPVVATDVGGNAEALGDAGMIVRAHSPIALSQALSTISQPDKLRTYQQATQQRTAQFSLDRCVTAHENLYRKLIAAKENR